MNLLINALKMNMHNMQKFALYISWFLIFLEFIFFITFSKPFLVETCNELYSLVNIRKPVQFDLHLKWFRNFIFSNYFFDLVQNLMKNRKLGKQK